MGNVVTGTAAKIAIRVGDDFTEFCDNSVKEYSGLIGSKFRYQGELAIAKWQIKVYRKTRSKQPRVVRVLKTIWEETQ